MGRDGQYEFVQSRENWIEKIKSGKDGKSCGDISDAPLLSCRDVVKSYGATKALSGISLSVPRGKVLALLGPNGSGKTTLMKIVAGLLREDSGEVRVLGDSVGISTKTHVAYLPDRCSLPSYFTVGDAVSFYEDFFSDFSRSSAEKILSELSIDKNKRIKALSKGLVEKVCLALVMSRRADLYVLDEPISGVDPASRDYIIDTIIKNVPESSSVIISTHLISDIERIMDEFVFMKYGEIYAQSTPDEIRDRYGISVDTYFREVFKC